MVYVAVTTEYPGGCIINTDPAILAVPGQKVIGIINIISEIDCATAEVFMPDGTVRSAIFYRDSGTKSGNEHVLVWINNAK